MKARPSLLEVYLDAESAGTGPVRIGTLNEDRGSIRFEYDREWVENKAAFQIDPSLALGEGVFHPRPEVGNFGVFLDSSPDRWGQTLMRRREALEARDEERKPRQLYGWDFLIGVQDATRQGALRFREPGKETYLDAHPLPAPPITSLRELEAIAFELSAKKIDDLDKLRKWLSVLVAPGASLGGARPKANFVLENGELWIAKFPAHDDYRDIGAWESVMHQLAQGCGVEVSQARLFSLDSEYHTFATRRFDRYNNRRRHYCSAMTMLAKQDGENSSYLELAEFLQRSGDRGHVDSDLRQLFTRVIFGIAAGHRDDHLRNHGFVMGAEGWRLSPAFDLNPIIDKAEHVLAIDDSSHDPDISIAVSTHSFYRLNSTEANAIVRETLEVVANWKALASREGISAADIEITGAAFTGAGRGQ